MMSDIIAGNQTWRGPEGLHFSEEEIAVPGISACLIVRIVRWT